MWLGVKSGMLIKRVLHKRRRAENCLKHNFIEGYFTTRDLDLHQTVGSKLRLFADDLILFVLKPAVTSFCCQDGMKKK